MNPSPPKISETAKHKRRWLWAVLIALVVIPVTVAIVAGMIFVGRIVHSARQVVRDADAGFQKAKQTINPEELRAWALEEISKYPNTNNNSLNSPQIPNSEIPNYVQTLFAQVPEDAWVNRDGDQTYVKIFWGGPFFHWTFEIGSTNFVPLVNSVETAIKWVPGIYFTKEDK